MTIHEKIDPRPYTERGKTGRDELMDEVRRVDRERPLTSSPRVPEPADAGRRPAASGAGRRAGDPRQRERQARRASRRRADRPRSAGRERAPDEVGQRGRRLAPRAARRPAASSPPAATGRRSPSSTRSPDSTPDGEPLPTMGILPLGTGNGWAHALGAPKLHRCLEMLAAHAGHAADAPLQPDRGRGHARPLRGVGLGRDDPRRLQAPARGEQGARAGTSRRACTGTSRRRSCGRRRRSALFGNPHVDHREPWAARSTASTRTGRPRSWRASGAAR